MRIEGIRLDVDPSGPPWMEFGFPSSESRSARADEPRALLSLHSAGSMRYLRGSPNPRRAELFAELGIEGGRVVATELHHTRRVRFIDRTASVPSTGTNELDASSLAGNDEGDGGPDRVGGRDGIIVIGDGYVPTITIADCMPIWLLDRASGAYGILHSGWKGTGILAHAVRGLETRYATAPADISVILGPAIGSCCYMVSPGRAAAYASEFGADSVVVGGERPRLDLRAANIAIAGRLGVGAVLSIEACTSCESALGSFRREGPAAFTRMLALCGSW